MSLATFWRDVAECRAWEKRLHEGSAETRKAAALPGWPEWVLPLMMPLVALAQWKLDFSVGWLLVPAGQVLFHRERLFPSYLPTEWEALALPSRKALLLARWTRRLPVLLWFGACFLSWITLHGMRKAPSASEFGWTAALAYLLLPMVVIAAVPWFLVRAELCRGGFGLSTLIFVLLAASLGSFSALAFQLGKSWSDRSMVVSVVSAGLAILALLPVLPSLRPLGSRGREGWGSALGVVLFGVVGVSSLVFLFGSLFVAPRTLIPMPGDDGMSSFSWSLILAVLLLLFHAGDTLRLLPRLDLADTAPPETRSRKRRTRDAASQVGVGIRPGGGLTSTAWTLYRGRWKSLRFPWIEGPLSALWDCRAFPYGFLAVCFMAWGHASWGRVSNFTGGTVLLAATWLLPSPLELPQSRRLHLLGAEFEDVVRHNRKWGFLLAVAPVFVGGTMVLLIPDTFLRFDPLLLWGAVLACTGAALLFKCDDADRLFRVAIRAGWGRTLAVTGAAFVLWLASPRIGLMVLGPAIFLAGLAWVIGDYLHPAAAARRMAEDAVDD